MNYHIDINCDMGESFGNFKIGNDLEIFPYITSCNIACGFHGGDPATIIQTILHAGEHHIQIGAHPSYPDLSGFGRREMHMDPNELKAYIKYQIAALKGLTESTGEKLRYVKPHGALYNSACDNEDEASAIAEAVAEFDAELALLGLAGSQMQEAAAWSGIRFIAEAFADRRYNDNGRLMSRSLTNAVITDPEEASKQVLSIAMQQKVMTSSGVPIPVKANSICIHGDNPKAIAILKSVRKLLGDNNIEIKPFFE